MEDNEVEPVAAEIDLFVCMHGALKPLFSPEKRIILHAKSSSKPQLPPLTDKWGIPNLIESRRPTLNNSMVSGGVNSYVNGLTTPGS